MHVMFFLPSAAGGGAEKAFALLANTFAHNGVKTSIAFAKPGGPIRSLLAENVSCIDLMCRSTLRATRSLAKTLLHEQVTHLITGIGNADVVGALASWIGNYRGRRIASVHTSPVMSTGQGTSIRQRIVGCLLPQVYKTADHVVCCSHGVSDELAHYFGVCRDRITTIYNPIDINEIQAKASLYHNYSLPKNYFAALARLEPVKNLEFMLTAFAKACQSNDFYLVICGDGSLRESLIKRSHELGVAKKIIFLGYLDNPYPVLAGAKALLVTSKYEGFGNVIVEAMSLGVPTISVNCPFGPSEIIDNHTSGLLVPSDDIEAFCYAMNKLINGQIKFSTISLKRRSLAFSHDIICNQFLGVIR